MISVDTQKIKVGYSAMQVNVLSNEVAQRYASVAGLAKTGSTPPLEADRLYHKNPEFSEF